MVHQSVFSDISYRGHVLVTSMCKIIESIAIFIQYHPSRFATELRIWYVHAQCISVLTQSIANAWERSKSRLQSCKHLSKQVILMFHPPLLDSSQPASSVCATYCLKQRQVSLQPSISIELYAALPMPRCRHVPIGCGESITAEMPGRPSQS